MEDDTRDRWNVDIPCCFRREEMERRGRILNLSEVGAFVESKNPYPVGSAIGLSFVAMDEEREIVLGGDVVHTGEYLIHGESVCGFGIEFVGTSLSTVLNLRQFLRECVIPAASLAR